MRGRTGSVIAAEYLHCNSPGNKLLPAGELSINGLPARSMRGGGALCSRYALTSSLSTLNHRQPRFQHAYSYRQPVRRTLPGVIVRRPGTLRYDERTSVKLPLPFPTTRRALLFLRTEGSPRRTPALTIRVSSSLMRMPGRALVRQVHHPRHHSVGVGCHHLSHLRRRVSPRPVIVTLEAVA